MSAEPADDYQEYAWNQSEPETEQVSEPDYASLFDAPDYVKLMRGGTGTKESREYAEKVRSMLKTGVVTSLRSGHVEDAATLLHYGPEFATATGELAVSSERARKVLDMITSPDSPALLFGITAAALIMQLARNHEAQLSTATATRKQQRAERRQLRREGIKAPKHPAHKFTISLPFGRKFTFNIRFRFQVPIVKVLAASMRAQTYEPSELATKVFTDPKLIAELRKQGIPVIIRD